MTASGGDGQDEEEEEEEEGGEVWRRRQSMQASGGQEVCSARGSPNGAAVGERETGKTSIYPVKK